MTNPLRLQIEEMEPRRYARAAKRAAEAAERSARKEGIEVSARIRHLLDSTEDGLAEEQRQRLQASQEPDLPAADPGMVPRPIDLAGADAEIASRDRLEANQSPSVARADLRAAVRAAITTLLPSELTNLESTGVNFAQTLGPSLVSVWLNEAVTRTGSTFAEAAVTRPTGRDLPLRKGEGLMSADGAWEVTWALSGDLWVLVRGDEPWSMPLADDDLVTVDLNAGMIVIKGTTDQREARESRRNVLDSEHKSISRRISDHVQVIRIHTQDRSPVPAVIASPTWERLRFLDAEKDAARTPDPVADVV